MEEETKSEASFCGVHGFQKILELVKFTKLTECVVNAPQGKVKETHDFVLNR